jgi:hypothetical protein
LKGLGTYLQNNYLWPEYTWFVMDCEKPFLFAFYLDQNFPFLANLINLEKKTEETKKVESRK